MKQSKDDVNRIDLRAFSFFSPHQMAEISPEYLQTDKPDCWHHGHMSNIHHIPKRDLLAPPSKPAKRVMPTRRSFDKRTDYESNPDLGDPSGEAVFDTHCHLDRMYREDKFREAAGWKGLNTPSDPLGSLRSKFPEAFGSNFKGRLYT